MALLGDDRRRDSQRAPRASSKASCSMRGHMPDPQGPCGPDTRCSAAPSRGEAAQSLEGSQLAPLVLLWELVEIAVSHGEGEGLSVSPACILPTPTIFALFLPLSSPFFFFFRLKLFLLHDRILFFNVPRRKRGR